ncbi:DUF7563 family protein [Natronorarus salvus]|uniref:DUF7563 family protein n=1 Tax=Natronorarus salvus TaxID=3117733 RepID=UPI002F268032
MPECTQCGAFVTPDFVRVFGDNTKEVHGCLSCTSSRKIYAGRGARSGEFTSRPELGDRLR